MACGATEADEAMASEARLKAALKRVVPPVLWDALRSTFKNHAQQILEFGPYAIRLPADHMLPANLRGHPRYDRFLPHLAAQVAPGAAIVDIGANVGDTLAAMAARNPRAAYVCVEADSGFFDYLDANIAVMKSVTPDLTVHAVRALAGQDEGLASLEGCYGTKRAVFDARGTLRARPLDAILSGIDGLGPIRLLKIDVDGFDASVIASGMATIRAHAPMIHFECQFDDDRGRAAHLRAMSALRDAGYADWTVFDNYGAAMLRGGDPSAVAQLLDYLARQNEGAATRTIAYYDILAACAADRGAVDAALAAHR